MGIDERIFKQGLGRLLAVPAQQAACLMPVREDSTGALCEKAATRFDLRNPLAIRPKTSMVETDFGTRDAMPPLVRTLRDPAAQKHQSKGCAFLLASGSIVRRVVNDWPLLTSLLCALCLAREHQCPKLHVRLRSVSADSVLVRRLMPGSEELGELLGRKVHLFLHVKVKENWDEDRGLYRDIGLDWVE